MAKATRKIVEKRWCYSGMVAASIGIALMGLGVFLLLSFFTGDVALDPVEASEKCWTGLLGSWIAFGGVHTVGKVPALVLAFLVFFWGTHIAWHMRLLTTWPQVTGGALIVAAVSLGTCAFADSYDIFSGGLLAVYVSPPALLYFGRWGLVLAASGVLVLGILLAFGETAVLAVHQLLALLRNGAIAFVGVLARLGELLRMLLFPRLALVGQALKERKPDTGTKVRMDRETRVMPRKPLKSDTDPVKPAIDEAAERKTEAEAVAANTPDDADADANTDTGEPDSGETMVPPLRRRHFDEFKPRESFKSNFLDIDFRDPSPAAASEPVQASLAPSFGDTRPPQADVIMDVDAEAEESDAMGAMMEESASEVLADPVAITAPARPVPQPERRPRPAAETARPGAYGNDRPDRPAAAQGSDLSEYRLPPIELLDPPEPPVIEDQGQIEARARILEQTLSEFKIEGRVVHIERGPRVTMYEISLAPGIRLNKVTSLADNIAMQLKAESVRIIAPIPGKNTIGIEIPNTAKELVSLREIVDSVNREKRKQALPVCLGKDVSGSALVADLARMPHLLIAGATGSGKSVCINSIILSLMMCCKPDETQLIMVDPKVVELSRFKDIPHLMSPVITDMKRAVSVLDWICQKMDERYEQLSMVSVNNIAKFNALGEEGIRTRLDAFASLEEIEAFPKKLPYMVVIIDELADLMMVAGKEVEHHITRLAAKSRAVGIHLILATQRPSVDVITGLIKANMPCRIAFQVASRVDSRTILDGNGAETLLGQGDMLYLPPGVGKLTRAQGVFVSDEELFRIVDFTKAEAEPQYHSDLLGPVIGGGSGDVDVSSFDELFLQSGETIIENQRGSVSLLQRKFGIGYGRASRIIDQLASVGLLGPFRDGKAREILLTMEEFRTKFGGGGDGYGDAYDDDEGGSLAGLRDDEREPDQAPWDEEDDVA